VGGAAVLSPPFSYHCFDHNRRSLYQRATRGRIIKHRRRSRNVENKSASSRYRPITDRWKSPTSAGHPPRRHDFTCRVSAVSPETGEVRGSHRSNGIPTCSGAVKLCVRTRRSVAENVLNATSTAPRRQFSGGQRDLCAYFPKNPPPRNFSACQRAGLSTRDRLYRPRVVGAVCRLRIPGRRVQRSPESRDSGVRCFASPRNDVSYGSSLIFSPWFPPCALLSSRSRLPISHQEGTA